jgi:hypothetical protein
MKTLVIACFDVKGSVHFEFIPQGHTVNKVYYVGILKWLHDGVHRKMPEWILHHNNVQQTRCSLLGSFWPKNQFLE